MTIAVEGLFMEAIKVWNKNGEVVGDFAFQSPVFDGSVNSNVLHQAVKHQLASARQGTASSKTRSEIRGSTKKPWRQKGTGRARAGSSNSPLWRGGGVVFGPHPRDFSTNIPKKVLRRAFVSVLNSQIKGNNLLVLEDFEMKQHSTKIVGSILQKLVPEGRLLFVLNPEDEGTYPYLRRSSRNLGRVRLANQNALELKDLYYAPKVVLLLSAAKQIDERMTKAFPAKERKESRVVEEEQREQQKELSP